MWVYNENRAVLYIEPRDFFVSHAKKRVMSGIFLAKSRKLC